MERLEIRELAASMTRMYGARQALHWAERYSANAYNVGNSLMHARWAAVAALLGETLDRQERYGSTASADPKHAYD